MRASRMRILALLLLTMLAGGTLAGCETVGHAFDSVKDAID